MVARQQRWQRLLQVSYQHFIDRSKQACVGLEINANHLKSVKEGGTVTAIAEPVHTGRATIVYGINIFDERERLICVSRCTLAVITK